MADDANRRFEPIIANENGHLLHIWTDAEGVLWACCAYDHGPLCCLCQRSDDDTTMSLLSMVEGGDMVVRAAPDGEFQFKLTEQGNERAKRLIKEPGDAQQFYDDLVVSHMEKDVDAHD